MQTPVFKKLQNGYPETYGKYSAFVFKIQTTYTWKMEQCRLQCLCRPQFEKNINSKKGPQQNVADAQHSCLMHADVQAPAYRIVAHFMSRPLV